MARWSTAVVVAVWCACDLMAIRTEAKGGFEVRIRFRVDRSIRSERIAPRLKDEAEAIWGAYGVQLEWTDGDTSEPSPSGASLDVAVQREAGVGLIDRPPILGRTVVTPDPRSWRPIRVSFDAVEKVLTDRTTSRASGAAMVMEPELGRALGRVLAHEMGHVLLNTAARSWLAVTKIGRQQDLSVTHGPARMPTLSMGSHDASNLAIEWPHAVHTFSKGQDMKKGFGLALVLLCAGHLAAAAGHDDDSVVSWRNIAGVITAPGIDNPVAVTTNGQNVIAQIHSGTLPWITRAGSASVDLTTGAARFAVTGLVLIGGNASGTAGPINQVVGTLVCNPGSTALTQPQTVVDTPPVSLSANGNARFSGELTDTVPVPCNNPLFLIRIGPAFGDFAGRWLATGVEPQFGHHSNESAGNDRRNERR